MDGWNVPGYTAVTELGAGAFGRVVRARRDADGREVAVKVLTDGTRRAGFAAEARLMGAVRSRHVVRLDRFVTSPRSAAIVMELVAGPSVRTLLEGGALPLEAALLVFRDALRGLADAHRAGVVHRDVKPGNLLVGARGAVKLADFGIAVPAGTEAEPIGTPAYMPPEQWRGLPADPSGDLYACTAVFFECLTGRRPYQGRYLPQLAAQHLHADVPAASAPAALRPLVRRGLAKEPGDRPSGALALLDELESAARRCCGRTWERRGRQALTVPAFDLAA